MSKIIVNIAVLNFEEGNVLLFQNIELTKDDDADLTECVEEFLSEQELSMGSIEYMCSEEPITIIL